MTIRDVYDVDDFEMIPVFVAACGSVIGQANAGNCFLSKGMKQTCILSGVNYEFFLFNFAGRVGASRLSQLIDRFDIFCSIQLCIYKI